MKFTLKFAFLFVFLSLLIWRPTPSYAYWHDGGHGGWHGHSYVGVNIGVWPGSYYYGYPYYDYPYYAQPYYPREVLVSSSSYQPVVINGVTYYVNNGVYYNYTAYGYQAVATPVGVVAAPTAVPATAPIVQADAVTVTPSSVNTDDSYTVNIPNGKGGYNAVLLKRSGNGFIGPQGEFYAEFPKVSQLQLMYGK